MKRINISLTTPGSLNSAIEYLKQYKEEISNKTKLFMEELLESGKSAAIINSGDYKGFIVYKTEISKTKNGYDGMLIATDGKKIERQWYRDGRLVSSEVSPLLMAEFGSGWLSEVLFNVSGVGQGTFPGQIHAFDEKGWYWTTEDGVKHYSRGEKPTHPMHNAMNEMIQDVERIAVEVFK